jgi:hypothetical protein
MTKWFINGIANFGDLIPAGVGGDTGWTNYGYLWDGTMAPFGSAGDASGRLMYPDGMGDATFGPWLVIRSSTDVSKASVAVVSSPVFSGTQDATSLAMTASPGESIAVQCIPLELGTAMRDPSTGAWPALIVDSVCSQVSAPPPANTMTLELYYLDATRRTLVGSPGTAWSDTPAATFTARTSWTTLTPPTTACAVAIRFTWSCNGASTTPKTAYVRSPALGWEKGELRNITSGGGGLAHFATRYV